ALDDEEIRARLEPAVDAVVGIGDDRSSGRGELERTAGRRRIDARVGAASDAQVDPRSGDCTREGVEGNVADEPSVADVPLKGATAEREVDVRERTGRLADERGHPVAAELVAVAVEKHVGFLVDRLRREEVGVGSPEDGLGPARAEGPEAVEASLGV